MGHFLKVARNWVQFFPQRLLGFFIYLTFLCKFFVCGKLYFFSGWCSLGHSVNKFQHWWIDLSLHRECIPSVLPINLSWFLNFYLFTTLPAPTAKRANSSFQFLALGGFWSARWVLRIVTQIFWANIARSRYSGWVLAFQSLRIVTPIFWANILLCFLSYSWANILRDLRGDPT